MIAPTVAALAASFVAGHPVQIACDVTGTAIEGWTSPGSNVIHLRPSLCEGLASPPTSPGFAAGFDTLVHEAAHAQGIVSESCAQGYPSLYGFELLRRFYRLPPYSSTAWNIMRMVWDRTLRSPPEYRPSGDGCVLEVVHLAYGSIGG